MTRHFSARRVGRGIVKLGWVGTGETKHNCTLPSGLPLDETLFFRSRKKGLFLLVLFKVMVVMQIIDFI